MLCGALKLINRHQNVLTINYSCCASKASFSSLLVSIVRVVATKTAPGQQKTQMKNKVDVWMSNNSVTRLYPIDDNGQWWMVEYISLRRWPARRTDGRTEEIIYDQCGIS